MKDNFSIFKKYPTVEQARELKDLLEKNGIECHLVENIPPVDITFSGNTLHDEYEIQLKPEDFEKAESLLIKNAEDLIGEIDKDYYLFDFTNEELYEVLLKADEWNEFDYTLAQKILKERGKSIDRDLLNSLKAERLKHLAKPEENQRAWIIGGYVFSFIGGFLGIVIGYFIWSSKKTLPNGQKVYTYSNHDRKHAKYIFYIGIIIFPTTLFLRLLTEN